MEFNNRITGEIKTALAEAIVDGAKQIAKESKKQAPVASGALKENCTVAKADNSNVTVGYDLPYAVLQHEDLEARHESGKAKFLEDPFNAAAEGVINTAAEYVKRVIE